MEGFRSRLMAVFIVIMSILCMIAVFIAVRVSVTMLERYNQIAKSIPAEENKLTQTSGSKPVIAGKFVEQVLYFNGEKADGVNAFLADKKECFIPADAMFAKLGIKYGYYSPDDLFEAGVDGKKLLVKTGSDSVSLGGERIKLPAAAVAARDHILVPGKLFNHFNGFSVDGYTDKGIAFMNHYPDYKPQENIRMRVLRLNNGMAGISDIAERAVFWKRNSGFKTNERVEVSPDNSMYMLKSFDDGRVYIIKGGTNAEPWPVNASLYATWSADGKNLYWIDEEKGTSYIYDLKSGKAKELGNYCFRIRNNEDAAYPLYGGDRLYEYREGNGYKRIVLTAEDSGPGYTFIERNGSVVIEGNVVYSPDRKKVLFERQDGFYAANADGTGIISLGNHKEARWVNNNRIFLRTGNEMLVCTKNGRIKTRVGSEWKLVGQTREGDVLFIRDGWLYSESNGAEKKIMELPWDCAYAWGLSASGLYIGASEDREDGVFCLKGGKIVKIGENSLLLNRMENEGLYADYRRSIIISPNNRSIGVFQRENGLIALNLVNVENMKQRKVVLNCRTNEVSGVDDINSRWISDSRLLVYTAAQGWVIDFRDGLKIHDWTEQPGRTIAGVLVN